MADEQIGNIESDEAPSRLDAEGNPPCQAEEEISRELNPGGDTFVTRTIER